MSGTGKLTTHVLDTMHGRPAARLEIGFFRVAGGGLLPIVTTQTNIEGRCDEPLLTGADMVAGTYELQFHVGDYFRDLAVATPEPPFLDVVPVRFGIADTGLHYHVPLLVSPYGYSSYRGS